MSPEADETIITRFIAKTAGAIGDIQKYREGIDQLKAAALKASIDQKASLKDLEKAWIDLAKAQKVADIKQVKATLLKAEVPTADQTKAAQTQIQTIQKQYADLVTNIRTAFDEVGKEQQQYFAGQSALIKENIKQRSDAEKQSVADTKQSVAQKLAEIKNYVQFQKELERQAQTEIANQTKEAAAAAREYAQITKQGYGVMSEGARQYGAQVQVVKAQIQQIATQTGVSFQEAAKQLAVSGTPINQINQALKELNPAVKETGSSFRIFGQEIKNIGDLGRVVLLGIFGVGVLQMFRNLINTIKEATQAGYEFAKAIFQLEVGARALQRAGVDVTIQQIYEQIGSLQERFKIFTTKDLVVGTAAFLNLNRDMGFTREQLFKLQDAIATLAVVNGRAMDEVQRTVALALSSGYTEGLQRLGVSINRVTIANEAGRLGFAKSYMALTEQQRALATYNLVIQKTAIYQEDLQKYFETAPGAVDRTKTAFQEFKNQLGLLIATNVGTYLQDIYKWLEGINKYIEEIKKTRFVQFINDWSDALADLNKRLKDTSTLTQDIVKWMLTFTFIKTLPSPFGEIIASLERMVEVKSELDKGILGDTAVNEAKQQADKINNAVSDSLEQLETFQKEYDQKIIDLQTDHDRDIEKLELDAARRREEIHQDLFRDLANIDSEGLQKLTDLQQDWYNKLQDIEAGRLRDIAEENAKYGLEVAQTQRDFALRRAEMEARYRENEKKAEIRFQEEMRRLREGFLFDLEDALHERDARQVLRLIRQYNLQKTQAERQYEIEKDERQRAFQLELKELEAQRQERLRILAEEHAARLAAIEAQAAYERALAERKYNEDKARLEKQLEDEKTARVAKALEAEKELADKLKQAKDDRDKLLTQQKADLEAERDALLKEIGDKLWGAVQLTTEDGLKALYDALEATLGPGKATDEIFGYYVKSAQAASASVAGELASLAVQMAAIAALAASLSGVSIPGFPAASIPGAGGAGAPKPGGGTSSGKTTTPKPGKPRQMGGEVYAGETYKVHKDETYVPAVNGRILSVQQSQQAVAQGRSPMGGGKSEMKIGIALSDGLVGEIIQQASNAAGDMVADVVVSLERKRK